MFAVIGVARQGETIGARMSDKICGAKTRNGTPCQNKPLTNGRCRMHGGTNTGAGKGNKNALKHGIYSRVIDPKDLDEASDMQGSIAMELAIARIQLANLLQIQALQGETPQLDELVDETLADGQDEETERAEKMREADRCGEPFDDEIWEDTKSIRQESEPLKRKRVYRRRDFGNEYVRLTNLIARLEIAELDIAKRKNEMRKDKEAEQESKKANVKQLNPEQIASKLAGVLGVARQRQKLAEAEQALKAEQGLE